MESLKLKVFDVLTETISVEEFEQWLYSTTDIINSISSNTLVYNIVNINYKGESGLEKLLKLTNEEFSYEENKVILIIQFCKKINSSTNKTSIFQIVQQVIRDFDYEGSHKLLWTFYRFGVEIDLIKEGFQKEGGILRRIQSLTQQVVLAFDSSSSIDEKIKILDYQDPTSSN